MLDIHGCIVSVDALNCQKKTAAQIIEQGGDYLLALKDNHPHMYEDVRNLFAWARAGHFVAMVHAEHTETGSALPGMSTISSRSSPVEMRTP